MSEREGERRGRVPKEILERLRSGQVAQKPVGQGPSGCSLVIVYGPNGDIIDAHCGGGSCGIIDWFLGRSCKAVDTGNSIYCACVGGWWDRIFGSSP